MMKIFSFFFNPFKKQKELIPSHKQSKLLHLEQAKESSLEDMYLYDTGIYFSSRIECINSLLDELSLKYRNITKNTTFHDYKEELILKRFLEQYIPNILEKYRHLNAIEKENGEEYLIKLLRETLLKVDKIIEENEIRKLVEFNKELSVASHMLNKILEKDLLED